MRLLIALITLGILVTTAHAQPASAPTLSVGDTWKRSNGLAIKVIAGDSGYVLTGSFANCPACESHLDKNLLLTGVTDADGKPADVTRLGSVAIGPNWKFYDWPLEVKKEWTISGSYLSSFLGRSAEVFRGGPIPSNVTIVIKAYEDVKTKAGRFKAKMEQRWSINHTYGSYRWINTVWYSPDAKAIIKFESSDVNTKDWELVSYSLK
jgi:hypothetical protein